MKSIAAKSILAAIAFVSAMSLNDNPEEIWVTGNLMPTAEAVIGRPGTPLSYAGVARRTTRRVIRRSTIYLATLPPGCGSVSINGTTLWQCGTTYYQADGSRYVVVYVD